MSESRAPTGGAWRRPAWLTRLRLALLLLLVTAVIGLIASARPARRYFVESSESCSSCHAESTREVHATAHAKLACSSCHEQRFGENLTQWALGLVSSATVTHGQLDPTSCKTCHAAGTVEPWRLARSQGHVAHVLEAEKPLECSACHELSGHGTAAKPASCVDCHDELSLFDHTAAQMPGGEPAPCLSCHEHLARTDVGKKTLVTDCRRCHGGAQSGVPSSALAKTIPGQVVSPGQIHANLRTCSSCHDPHAEDPAQRNLGTDCTRCHDKVSEEHHAQQQPERFDCSTCHEVHGPRAALSESCRGCHEQSNEPLTTVAREHERCTQCHEAHVFVAPKDGCQGCHAEAVTVLASWDAKQHADCRTCHEPHDPKPETARCAECHQKPNHGHPTCTSCHEPHQDAEHTKACGSCHTAELRGFQVTVAQHKQQGCASCHQPHVAGGEAKACRGCHGQETQLVATAKIGEHTQCGSCHEPHAFTASETACNGCHAIPASGPHSGACGQCHEEHGPPVGRAQSCTNCHQNVPRPAGAHAECTSCHAAPHAANDGVDPSCGGCHKPEAVAVSTWSVQKHQSCSSCHEAHKPTQPAACASCHAQIAPQVAPTGHRCGSCHDTHAPPQNIWGGCSSCHAGTVAAAAQRGPTHSACKSCHEPHTAAAPACASCHQSLPAAHTMRGHQRCSSCHSTHAPTQTNRAQCLSCHAQQKNHYPEASSCAGCHLFK